MKTEIRTSITAFAALATATLGICALTAATPTLAEPTGSVCQDCAAYKGEYSIENNTLNSVTYEFRWGDNDAWRTVVLTSGATKTHTYSLGTNPKTKVPTPAVRYGKTVYKVDFYAVMVKAPYGGTLSTTTEPKKYAFVRGDFQKVNLVEM